MLSLITKEVQRWSLFKYYLVFEAMQSCEKGMYIYFYDKRIKANLWEWHYFHKKFVELNLFPLQNVCNCRNFYNTSFPAFQTSKEMRLNFPTQSLSAEIWNRRMFSVGYWDGIQVVCLSWYNKNSQFTALDNYFHKSKIFELLAIVFLLKWKECW